MRLGGILNSLDVPLISGFLKRGYIAQVHLREYWKDTAAAGRAYVAVHPKGTVQFCALTTNNEAAKQAVIQQLKENGYYKSKNKSWKYYPFQNQKEKIKVIIKKSPSGTEIQVRA